MIIFNIIKLGHKNFLMHKKSSFCFVAFFSILFSLVVFISALLGFFKDTVSEKFEAATNGKVMVEIYLCQGSYQPSMKGEEKCEDPEIYNKEAREIAEKYHGDLIGAIITYMPKNGGETISVVPESATKFINAKPTYYAPDGKIPVITSIGYNDKISENNDFYIIGNYPGDVRSIYFGSDPNHKGFLDKFIYDSYTYTSHYLVFDATDKLENYLAKNEYSVYRYNPLLIFDNKDDAYKLYKDRAGVWEIFTQTLRANDDDGRMHLASKYMFMACVVIAIITIVVVLSLAYMRDEKIIMLYRSLGASRKDIAMIYFVDTLETIILTAVFAYTIGSIASAIAIAINKDAIDVAMARFFGN